MRSAEEWAEVFDILPSKRDAIRKIQRDAMEHVLKLVQEAVDSCDRTDMEGYRCGDFECLAISVTTDLRRKLGMEANKES